MQTLLCRKKRFSKKVRQKLHLVYHQVSVAYMEVKRFMVAVKPISHLIALHSNIGFNSKGSYLNFYGDRNY